jgi:4-amino-4-deoxy-L-arabinose transferase-like glycosyltransferase
MSTNKALALIVVLGALPPLLGVLGIFVSGFDLLAGTTDSDKYYRPALRVIETGYYGFMDSETGTYLPYLDTLPGYPYFIVAIFKIFGVGNYYAVVTAQCLLGGLTVLAISLSAKAFNPRWMWPAAILAAFWPNMVYRPTAVLTEALFLTLFTWGLCALLWISNERRVWISNERWVVLLLVLGGGALGMAQMTRPVLMLLPPLAIPALIYVLRKDLAYRWRHAVPLAVLPIVVMMLFTLPNYILSYNAYGTAHFTIQKGHNALKYVYPCLAAKWGCGTPDPAASARASKNFDARIAALPKAEQDNLVRRDKVATKLAGELIAELPLTQLARGIVGSTAKMLLHNVWYEILDRFALTRIHLGEMAGDSFLERLWNFLKEISAYPPMWPWLPLQILLIISRLVQVVGIAGVRDPVHRPRLLLVAAYMTAVAAVSFGFGNPRYRLPMEPGLILLTLFGLEILLRRFRLTTVLSWRDRQQPR